MTPWPNGLGGRMSRGLRRTQGYHLVMTRAVPAVRRNETLRDLTDRVLPRPVGPGSSTTPLRGGVYLEGKDVQRLPIMVFVVLERSIDQVGSVVEQIADLQVAERSFRPVILTDQPAFEIARAHGYVADLVVPAHAWQSEWGSRQAYLTRRVMSVRHGLRAWEAIWVDGPSLNDGARLTIATLTRQFPRLDPPVVQLTTLGQARARLDTTDSPGREPPGDAGPAR